MTHGQFTLDDYTNTQTLYTFHDGHTPAAVVELYSIMDYWVTRSADSVRWLFAGNPSKEEVSARCKSSEWKTRNCPGWCLIMASTARSPEGLQKILDTPGELEESERTGICFENADAIGIGQLMVARHWNRWYPYPEKYRGYPGDRFLVKILPVGEGTMDYKMHVELLDEDEDTLLSIQKSLEGVPCLEYSKDQPLPSVHFGNQFWHAMRRELQTLVKYAGR